MSALQMLGQVCGPEPCSSYAWQPGPWGECSAGCGLGTMWRDLSCTYLGQRVDNRYCAALSFPALTRPCYKRPCSLATWKFSSWGICNGQTQSRTVTCVNPDGTPTDRTVSFIYYIKSRFDKGCIQVTAFKDPYCNVDTIL